MIAGNGMIRAAVWRLLLVALLVGVLLAAGGCAVLVGLDRPLDPRWTYPDCSKIPAQGIVGVPSWMCPPPGPWNGESGSEYPRPIGIPE